MAGHEHHDWVITGKVIVEDLLNACPQAEHVFKKHLGENALAIPGAKTEAIEFLAAMHDYHEHILLEELNEVCTTAPRKTGHF
jgi:hypothetical protein